MPRPFLYVLKSFGLPGITLLGISVNRGNPPLDSFVICGHCHSRSTLVRIVLGQGEA
jgi:hypothetical protein